MNETNQQHINIQFCMDGPNIFDIIPPKHDCWCNFFQLPFQNIKVQIHLLDPVFE